MNSIINNLFLFLIWLLLERNVNNHARFCTSTFKTVGTNQAPTDILGRQQEERFSPINYSFSPYSYTRAVKTARKQCSWVPLRAKRFVNCSFKPFNTNISNFWKQFWWLFRILDKTFNNKILILVTTLVRSL